MSLPPIPPASTASSSASSSSHLPPRPSHLPAPPAFVTNMPDLVASGRDNPERYGPLYDSRENGGRGAGQSRDYDAGGEWLSPFSSSFFLFLHLLALLTRLGRERDTEYVADTLLFSSFYALLIWMGPDRKRRRSPSPVGRGGDREPRDGGRPRYEDARGDSCKYHTFYLSGSKPLAIDRSVFQEDSSQADLPSLPFFLLLLLLLHLSSPQLLSTCDAFDRSRSRPSRPHRLVQRLGCMVPSYTP